ncbi:sigma-54-dependent transcriptional regulator [Nitrospira sp. Nam80]
MRAGDMTTSTADRKTRALFTVLVVEDNATDVELILDALEQANVRPTGGEWDIEIRATAEGALDLLREQAVDLVLTDMMLPGMTGIELVSRIQAIDRNLPVLVVTRMNTVQLAVDTMRSGAFDYILKPVSPADLETRLHRAIRVSEIMRRQALYEQQTEQEFKASGFVGTSAAYHSIMRSIREAAKVRSTVLITGETGTGKGLIARAIHRKSVEHAKPFQIIDCSTIPEGVMESELFGHVRGAFTGAVTDKSGLIEMANGGTIFLDEIGELPLSLQAKLLRVLEDNEIRAVGSTRVRRIDVRFIAATNRSLEEQIQRGAFRKDLYYRLAIIPLNIPPLRERPDDIASIADHLLAQLAREMGKPGLYLEPSATEALSRYHWPGNVRELRNVIERAVMMADDGPISGAEIRGLLTPLSTGTPQPEYGSLYADLPYMEAKEKALADFTRAYLRAKLAQHEGVITKAADSSEIPRQHFSLLMKKHLQGATTDSEL